MSDKDVISNYHPWISTIYFIFMLGITMFCTHPIVLAASFFCAFTYGRQLIGRKIWKILAWCIFGVLGITLINVLLNHQGETILFYMNDNPITKESIVYGFVMGLLYLNIILWFQSLNAVVTTDKVVAVTASLLPVLSLTISMSLRFIPRYLAKWKEIVHAQKGFGNRMDKGNLIKRIIVCVNCISILITWALENALESSDSMKARGFGLKKRTAFHLNKWESRDWKALAYLLIIGGSSLILARISKYSYSPHIYVNLTKESWILFACFLLCGEYPVLKNIVNRRRWEK